ncbi:Phosphoserine aminotransferase, partial [Fragariocoptes setiger]
MSAIKHRYFTAGPAKIPEDVMIQAQKELLSWRDTGRSVLEMSHRSKDFDEILTTTEKNLRALMKIPDNYTVLFLQGGAQAQFDSVPMNLCSCVEVCDAEYLVTGIWSSKASKEAQKYVKVVTRKADTPNYERLPTEEEMPLCGCACYRYYCDNETIQGVEFKRVPKTSENCPLVCDMTSNFLSRPVDVSKFGIIFASAQKNCGTSGLAIVIVRDDLIGKHMSVTPSTQNYQIMRDNKSNYNTPPVYAIYLAGLCVKWILDKGGLGAMDKISCEKSSLLYHTIDESKGFYFCPVEKNSRSRMNVVFLIGGSKGNAELEKKFLAEAEQAGFHDLKGHRLVGGLRASLYHGVTLDDVRALIDFMKSFQDRNQVQE